MQAVELIERALNANLNIQDEVDSPEVEEVSNDQYLIDNRKFKLKKEEKVKPTPKVHGLLYPQEKRSTMTQKEKNDLFNNAVKPISTKYDFMTVDLSDEKRLDDLCNLSTLVSKTKAAHVMYDMDDVFKIVFPVSEGSRKLQKTKPVDLYTNYEQVTAEEVALSNEWYREWVDDDCQRENLLLTYKQLENSMTPKLFDKFFEKYEAYPERQKGGPLLFIIMMEELVTNSEQATTYLKKMVTTLKIRDFQGENVSRVASLIRGVHKHLKFIGKVPEDFPSVLIKIFQTSSVPTFNRTFEHMEERVRYEKSVDRKAEYPEIEAILKQAELRYKELLQSDEWSGLNAKSKGSVFKGEATPKKPHKLICWNCGKEGHITTRCPEPKNAERIAANRAKTGTNNQGRRGNNRSNGGGSANTATTSSNNQTNKYRPPEPAKNNKREIDGRHMYYSHKLKRWILDRTHPSNKEKLGLAANAASTTTTKTNDNNEKPLDNTIVKAWIANTSKSFEQSLRDFAAQYS